MISSLFKRAGAFLAPAIVVIGLIWLIRLLLNLFGGGTNYAQGYRLWMERSLVPEALEFWWLAGFLVIFGLVCSYFMYSAVSYGDYSYRKTDEAYSFLPEGFVAGALLVLCVGIWWSGWWNNKDVPRYYNQSTTFVVQDVENPPASLERLLEGASVGTGDCERVGKHDVPSCARSGDFLDAGWEARSASFAGAVRVMRQASGENSRVDLLSNTATILYPEAGEEIAGSSERSAGYWSAVRDGSNLGTPTEGIVEWDGSGRPTSCEFEGDFELNRALRGARSNSFPHLLADRYPNLRWRLDDVYGYCEGEEPVLVVPMYRNQWFGTRSVEAPGGVLTIRGSKSGDPQMKLLTSVEVGQLPGPAYPISIAKEQREEHVWAGGRQLEDRGRFGFKPTDAATQSENATEFLLRSREDGRTYWVTPLTPRGSDSQLVVAYSVVPADEFTVGRLNPMTIYVLDGQTDERVVNLDSIERDVRDIIVRENPGFLASDEGKLEEFVPAADGTWRAYGVISGQPYYEVEVDPINGTPPVITRYNEEGQAAAEEPAPEEGEEGSEAEPVCAADPAELNNERLLDCQRALIDEIERRQQQPLPPPDN